MALYRCDRKILLRFYNQGTALIKDYSSNITKAPQNAFVDGKGKIVAFFDQVRRSDDETWAVVERHSVDRLLKHLFKYLYITDTKVAQEESHRIYWDLDGSFEPTPTDVMIEQRVGKLILSTSDLPADVSEAEMTAFRVLHGIPWQGIDFEDEMILCVADEERISYLKGCYLGQEVVARVHYKGRPPKKLVVKTLGDCDEEQRKKMTSRVRDPQSGDFMGFVFDKT